MMTHNEEEMDLLETRSEISSCSRASKLSTASSLALRARAKAEAARTELSFAKKEAEMLKQQAILQASLHELKMEKAAAAADAEANVLEAAAQDEYQQFGSPLLVHRPVMPQIPIEFPSGRATTQSSVQNPFLQPYQSAQTANTLHAITTPPDAKPPVGTRPPASQPTMGNGETAKSCVLHSETQRSESSEYAFAELAPHHSFKREDALYTMHANTVKNERHSHGYGEPPHNIEHTSDKCVLPQSHPAQSSPLHDTTSSNPSAAIDLAKYLMRREMVSSGLLTFDDKPENYWAWKTSFINSTEDLKLSAREELDLLCKWLGPSSSEQAKRIRAVHIHSASAGLQMVWQRLEDIYGSPEVIEDALLKKIDDFPKITAKDNHKLRQLGDTLMELEAARADGYLPGLMYLNTSRGVSPIVQKLPYNLQERWITVGSRYKEQHRVSYPPFSVFVNFVCEEAKVRNDPSFANITGTLFATKTEKSYSPNYQPFNQHVKSTVAVRKTEISSDGDPDKLCPLHNKPHPLRKCRGFRNKTIEERKAYLKEKSICFRCCASSTHIAKDCNKPVQCKECNSDRHPSALHPGSAPWKTDFQTNTREQQGGEQQGEEQQGREHQAVAGTSVTSRCTEICGDVNASKSCSKICLVWVYPNGQRERALKTYAVLDDQSNKSLGRSKFFEHFGLQGTGSMYTLKTCSGVVETSGRRASNFIVESLDGKTQISLPTLIECDLLPDNRSEIPSPEVTRHYPHLMCLTDKIPAPDPDASILLLLGRDMIQAHKVREQCNGPNNAPFAQRLDLGWVLIGDVCLGRAHKTNSVSAFKTNVLMSGRHSMLEPCTSNILVKEKIHSPVLPHAPPGMFHASNPKYNTDSLGQDVFQSTAHDEKLGMSVEDKLFLDLMDKEVYMDDANCWVAPLPFRPNRSRLPNNRQQAFNRLTSLRRMLEKKKGMKDHFFKFMQTMFDSDQAEPAPALTTEQERWYLPIFGVYHPQKKDQIRVVFDSSAKHEGLCLNDVLLKGPDMNNSLLGVLLRFRKEPVAVMADVQKMFYCFTVREEHRDFLRFLWFEDNNPTKQITEYRMKVHVFGNSPSPAVAIYGLRKAALHAEGEDGTEAKQFIMRNFYVDDALASFPTNDEAISVLKRTKDMLAESSIKLHKIASNSRVVMDAFSPEERAKDLVNLELTIDPLPLQHSLGLTWSLQTDTFTFCVSREKKPFTRRGILSTVNGIYDPLGFAAPVTIQGKALVRELSAEQFEWDAPLPAVKEKQWRLWTDSVHELEQLQIKRAYVPVSLRYIEHRELCVFSDASTMAISAVAYLKTVDKEGHTHVRFVMGKSKLAPHPQHTIPRLELCAAVLAVEMADLLTEELDIDIHKVTFFTDSRIVLGYIHNTNRRFYVYVTNRVARIRKSTRPEQWNFVSTENNPADHGTRSVSAAQLSHTNWFQGPTFLSRDTCLKQETFELVEPDADADIRPLITAFITKASVNRLGSRRFERFSSWKALCRATVQLIYKARSCSKNTNSKTEVWTQAKTVIIRSAQQDAFSEEIRSLSRGDVVSKSSTLRKLNPFVDAEGLLRVGGRMPATHTPWEERHPIIVPNKQHIATLLVRHYHEQVAHQGRHLTEGALRSAGLWLIGGKRLVSNIIHKCVICKRLRGKVEEQQMASLPADRVSPGPPFTSVGVDVFGPWTVSSRRTRGGVAENKRWAVIFTCMVTRAVHIEVLESLSSSSFVNALRRFTAIRGPVRLFRSDQGTNFVGACKELQIRSGDPELATYLLDKGSTWTFNPPHASHMGGAWERMIGVARRILDALLLKRNTCHMSHEVLVTLMSEVMAIMNARPLVPVSSDPDMPAVLTPAMLLTQKIETVLPPSPGQFDLKDLHSKQWKQVQTLADAFWKRWRQEYLVTLQARQKWHVDKPNLNKGDVVLLKDAQAKRNEWPVGIVVDVFPSEDKKVRKVDVKVVKQGTPKVYLRPVSELVLLLKNV
ncbi:uncharacterized protein LOC117818374 isoform X1 [Notolabrus celidotus]|uniref:uncharacterized protein LOC117818374 isoform X1 n=2 Tax=Notolabrus celidotus TaxID=1203425 RepID=UPI00148FCCA9|nr:uncharacterized protein LOC117818374 isoform X1 [Notolabrus celidotus]